VNPRPLFAALLLIGLGNSPLQAACAGGVSNSFTVTGEVTNPTTFNISQLEQPQFSLAQANVTYFAAGSVVTESFTGVLLWDLLTSSQVGGIVTDPTIKNDILRKIVIVIVTGTDCYQSMFGAGEFDSFFGGSQIMVAYASGGQSLGSDGFARIVVPGDKAGGRFVSNIANIDVEDASSYPPPGKHK
jgi:Oxidoreductase molybdopterin binding domain